MPSSHSWKVQSSKDQLAYQQIARGMFKKEAYGKKVLSGLVGQIVRWDSEREFGFIRTQQGQQYYCRDSSFLTACKEKDIVKFDVWENFETESQKAINVDVHPASTVSATNEIGRIDRWRGPTNITIKGSDGRNYPCNSHDFTQGLLPLGARVCFDIITDWTGWQRATAIHKTVRHMYQSGVEGEITHLRRDNGFVSTELYGNLPFKGADLMRVIMQSITCHSRIICDVMMEEDGSLTAENVESCAGAIAIDMVKSAIVQEDDCVSTSTKAATDVPEASSELLTPEMRKLSKKLREIVALEARQDLDQLQQDKVAKKDQYQTQLARLTA